LLQQLLYVQVTQKVFELCGTPRLGRRSAQPPPAAAATTSQFVFEKRLEKIHRTPARPVKSDFELMLTELKKRLKTVAGFWSRLPYQMCDTQLERPPSPRALKDRESCWNGRDVGHYEAKVLEDGLANQMQNPEVPVVLLAAAAAGDGGAVGGGGGQDNLLAELRQRLDSLAAQLRSAYRGLDIEWWDPEDGEQPHHGHQHQRDAEGSGGGGDSGLDDDEDYAAGGSSGEGSGGGRNDEDEILVPAWTREKEQQRKKANNNKFETDKGAAGGGPNGGPASSGGTSSIHLRGGGSRTGLGRAVLTYLLPVITCYLGGTLAHLPAALFFTS
jgi:hypothetical protein